MKTFLSGRISPLRIFHEPPNDQQQQQSQVQQPPAEGIQQQQQTPPDPFASIDVNNLDDGNRKAFELVKQEHERVSKLVKEKEESFNNLQSVASRYQSEAAHAQNILKQHNLLPGQQPQQSPKSEVEQFEERMFLKFKSENMPEQQARSFARLQALAFDDIQGEVLKKVGAVAGPLARQTQGLVAQNLLGTAMQDPMVRQVLSVPEVYQGATEIISNLVNNGSQVTDGMVQMAIDSAAGKALRVGKFGQQQPPQQQQQTPPQQYVQYGQPNQQPPMTPQQPFQLFGSPPGNGGFQAQPFQPANNGQLVPKNQETADAIREATIAMDRSLGKVDHMGRPIKK